MSLHDYAGMLTATARIGPFIRAIEAAVRPGSRVLEVGTGLGTYAMAAARAGAAAVLAVDDDPVVHVAREVARANGLGETVRFARGRAPEDLSGGPWDLIVFEDYPSRLLDAPTWLLLRALVAEHLAPGGALLPATARLRLAPVLDPARRPALVDRAGGPGPGGLVWDVFAERLANQPRRVALPLEALGGAPAEGPTLDLASPPAAPELSVAGEWVGAGEPVVGLALWMELGLAPDVWISNRPGAAPEPWGQLLLPVEPPLAVPAGTPVRARVTRETLDDGAPGFMSWQCAAGGMVRRGHEFAGLPLSLDDLTGSGGPAP